MDVIGFDCGRYLIILLGLMFYFVVCWFVIVLRLLINLFDLGFSLFVLFDCMLCAVSVGGWVYRFAALDDGGYYCLLCLSFLLFCNSVVSLFHSFV